MGKKRNSSKSSRRATATNRPDSASGLPGWPGYRTREGRSGYDPIDTRTEAAHTAGTLLQRFFSGQVSTPLQTILLGFVGLVLVVPLALGVSETLKGHPLPWNAWLFLAITGTAGIVILINFIKNLIRMITQ